MVRFEFYEILVRIADLKFKQTKICETYSEAFEKLILDHIFCYGDPVPWQPFRDQFPEDQRLWALGPNDILEANLDNLKKIYQAFQTSVKKTMSLDDCVQMCTRYCDL